MRGLWVLVLLGACDGGVDTDDPCLDAPVVTWNSFGQDFVRKNCQACHGADAADRHGAPEGVQFATEEQVMERSDQVLQRAGAEPPTMPPLGGTTADERALLRVWLECGQ